MTAVLALCVIAAGAFAIHSLKHGDALALAAFLLCSAVYAATFAADYLLRCWRAGR